MTRNLISGIATSGLAAALALAICLTPVRRVTGNSSDPIIAATLDAGASLQGQPTGDKTISPQASFAFSNSTPITIPTLGSGSPYPSTITVSGVSTPVARVVVSLSNLSHTFPDDLDILLVGPLGQKAILMSDVGGSTGITNVSLTFDETASASLPDGGPLVTGTFRATDVNDGADTFPAPAPAGPYTANLSLFAGTNANGVWSLYVVDDAAGDSGVISGGWSLTIIDGNSVVTTTADSGPGSLRQAMLDANAAGGGSTISFNIPGTGVHTIMPLSSLPTIIAPVAIDATTQPGYAGTPLIELTGTSSGGGNGLTIFSPSCTIKGLVINGFAGDGIQLGVVGPGFGFETILGNYIGTNAAGTLPVPNGLNGIMVFSSNNQIGGTTSAERNLLSGNTRSGIRISGATATSNTVQGNYIGTNAAGTGALPNAQGGVICDNAPSNTIGGTTVAARNLISGNSSSSSGVLLTGSGTTGNLVRGNFIGTDVAGTSALSNAVGVLIEGLATGNIVGGTTVGARNIISGNDYGVRIIAANSNLVQGNFIGTDLTGAAAVPNIMGISIDASASSNTIGGAGAGNMIARNTAFGIHVVTGTGNAIFSNSIFANGSLGINLGTDGVTLNDPLDPDTGPNNLQNYPVLTSAIINSGNNTTTIIGSLDSTPSTTFTLQFFSNPACNFQGYGEGKTYLGSTTVTTTIDGSPAAFIAVFPLTVPVGYVVTATATNNNTHDTSEFSACVTVTGDSPTAIDEPELDAAAYDSGVLLKWKTGLEVNNLGFNVYRNEGGRLALVNRQLIAGSALLIGADITVGAGQSYQWWDDAPAGKATAYWLEDHDLNGQSRWHGPYYAKPADGESEPAVVRQSRTLASLASQEAPTLPVEARATLRSPVAGSALPSPMQSPIPTVNKIVKLQVKREAWYRVSAQELFDAGLDQSVDPRLLQLFVDGKQQAISVTGQDDGRLDAADTVEFYGMGVDSPFTELRTYYLIAAEQAGLRVPSITSAANPTPGGSFDFTVERRERLLYFSALKNGDKENFFGAVVASQPVEQTLMVNHLAASAVPASLNVALQGVTNLTHAVTVRLNGNDLGCLIFQNQAAGVASFAIPTALLREGDNHLTLIAQGGPADVSLVDYVQLTYSHAWVADDGLLNLTARAGQALTVSGFASDQIQVFDVTDPYAVQEISGSVSKQEDGDYSVALTVTGTGQRSLLAMTKERATRVAKASRYTAANLRDPRQGADLLIITPTELADSVRVLQEHRQQQGLSVAVVKIEDVYDQFSYGQKTPYGMKEFIRFARRNWQRPINYVLLFGDASFDPKDYLRLGDFDRVPTKLVDTVFLETASDDWLADFDNDGIADVAIGRLPVRTTAEAEATIKKLASYEQSQPAEEALLVADRNDGFNFEAANAALKPLLPANLRIVEVKRGPMGDQAAKAALIAAVNRGQRIVNYAGHASQNAWRGDLFTSADALQLQNDKQLTMFIMMTCLNGYFLDPAADSLAESLLTTPTGGAVAVWASSAMTFPAAQTAMNEAFYRQLLDRRVRLGDAAMRAKLATPDADVRRTWILFGDPTMPLK